jgi:hypothetical protein
MKFKTFDIEEDNARYREFLSSPQFRYATKAIIHYETNDGGLTPAEVWHEVDELFAYLKGVDAEDHADMVVQLFSQERRRLKYLERDGETLTLGNDQMDRTLTTVFYCMALRLERTCKDQTKNPHNDLIEAIVEELARIHHRVLPLLHYTINQDGDIYEARTGKRMSELDPMSEDENWEEALKRVFDHYCNRMWKNVERSHREQYNKFWNALIEDSVIVAMMREDKGVKGDEHKELGVVYNAKAIFNIFGMLYKRKFFTGINGWDPLAKAVSEHYDGKTKKQVHARTDYFKAFEQIGIQQQFYGFGNDLMERVVKMMN